MTKLAQLLSLLCLATSTSFSFLAAASSEQKIAEPILSVPLPNKIECRYSANQKLGIRFIPTETSKVDIIGFNDETNTTETLTPQADFDDSFSDSQLYIRYHLRSGEFGMYSEYLLARFWPGGRKINPGLMQATEASYVKDAEGKETEELHPLGRAALKCMEIK